MTTEDRIRQGLEARRRAAVADHDMCWERMISQWNAPHDRNSAWLMYAANYLINTRGLKWAVDPVRLKNRVPEATSCNLGESLQGLAFVLLTHSHADHADRELWTHLVHVNCHWIVPEHMLDLFLDTPGMSRSRYSVAISGREIVLPGVRVLPFDSPHGEYRAARGFVWVPATGYRVQTDSGVFLFPGDVRTYDPTFLERIGNVSTVFAHVFLGRSAALMPTPPLLDEFVAFYLACHPRRIVLSHLYELGRSPADCWRMEHARMIKHAFASGDRSIAVNTPSWHERVRI